MTTTRDEITVERLGDDGKMHCHTFRRGEYVKVWFSGDTFHAGRIVGISLARREVRVRYGTSRNGLWYSIGAIYPAVEPPIVETRKKVRLAVAIDSVNRKFDMPGGFTDADRVPA